MNETVKFWLENLYKDAIENAKATISNERIWEKGYDGTDPVNPHTENIIILEEYIKVLEEKLIEVK